MKAATHALDASAFIVRWFQRDDTSDLVTNLKLQKLLYFSQALFGAVYGRRLFKERIEAWSFGPVVPETYHAFKACGRHPIEVIEGDHDIADRDAQTALALTCARFGIYSAHHLVTLSHQEPAWITAFRQGANTVIDPDTMAGHFKDYWIQKLDLADTYDDRLVGDIHAAAASAHQAPRETADQFLTSLGL